MKQSANPFVTTLIGGVVFLLPLVVVLYVLGQGLALVTRAAQPLISLLPAANVGGVALARSLQRLGLGTAALLRFAPAGVPASGAAGRQRR